MIFCSSLERNVLLIANKYLCNRRKPPRKQSPVEMVLGSFFALSEFLFFFFFLSLINALIIISLTDKTSLMALFIHNKNCDEV